MQARKLVDSMMAQMDTLMLQTVAQATPGRGKSAESDPAKEFKGEDEQLNRAIAEVQAEMKTKGYDLPPVPPYPNRNPTPAPPK